MRRTVCHLLAIMTPGGSHIGSKSRSTRRASWVASECREIAVCTSVVPLGADTVYRVPFIAAGDSGGVATLAASHDHPDRHLGLL